MTQGQLIDYFKGVAWKRLSIVEADPQKSNQHEFNGVTSLKQILGSARRTFPARFLYLGDEEEDISKAQSYLTWYDARESHPIRSEYRLYFPTTSVSKKAAADDLLIIGRQPRPDGSLMVIIAKKGTSFESQMFWLFGIADDLKPGFGFRSIESSEQIGFASGLILEELGIEVAPASDEWLLDEMLKRFNGKFPSTRVFSTFARETVDDIAISDDPDAALISWMEREELLFKTLERHIVSDKLKTDIVMEDVDEFLRYSLSVQNRRKSRTGFALENHLEAIFIGSNIIYSRGKETEDKAKPDFLFPGIEFYHDVNFPSARLSMLAAKSTCKDRWRQALSEAARIEHKHLLTLEPSISVNQTNEMEARNLQLVVPQELHQTYRPEQRDWLMDLNSFIQLVRTRQDVN